MSKYSLKRALYGKNKLLNEMAIITQTNFIDRIINLAKSNPKISGGYYNSFEEIEEDLENASLEDKEDTLFEEIIKCVIHTNLLSLTGKENKKARKQAEILIIKQLRKYKNIDGEYIDFKGILPMFDSIADFLEEKADVNFDECINSADLYMRNFYNIANKEDKSAIDQGKFEFEEVLKKTSIYRDFTEISAEASKSIVPVYEDDTIKVVWPATHEAFCKALVDLGYSLEELTHCTKYPSSWRKHHRDHYVTIATPKNNEIRLDKDDPEYFFSLKVSFEGEIEAKETCDRYNQHCDEDIIDEYFSPTAREGIRNLPEIAKGITPDKPIDYDRYIEGFADLNDIKSLTALFTKMFALLPHTEVFNKIQNLYKSNKVNASVVGRIIAESVSSHLFDSPGQDEYDYIDLLNAPEYYPVKETMQYFKEKIVKNGSHLRYFNTLLLLKNIGLDKLLTFDDIKKAIEVATKSDNTANFKRLVSSLLNNNDVSYYLNYKSIPNKSAGLTEKNYQIYDIIYSSPSMNNYIAQNKISTITHAAKSDLKDAKTFLSFLALRFTDDFIAKVNSTISENQISIQDVNNSLFGAYLLEDLGPNGIMSSGFSVDDKKVFVGSNLETYSEMRKQLFTDVSFANNVLKEAPKELRQSMIMFICNSLKTNKNPLELEKDGATLRILEKLLSYNDYSATFILDQVIFRLPYEMSKLSSSVKASINSIIFSNDSLRNNFSFISSLALGDSSSRLKSHLFDLISNLEEAKKQEVISAIVRDGSKKHLNLTITTLEKLSQKLNDIVLNLLNDSKVISLVNHIFKTSLSKPKFYEERSRTFNLENITTVAALSLCESISENTKKDIFITLVKAYLTWIPPENNPESNYQRLAMIIEEINPQCAVSQEIIDMISDESKIPSLARQYLANKTFNSILNKVFMGLYYKDLVIPKKLLAAIFSSTTHSRGTRPQRDLKANLLKNFINLSDDGKNYLQGEDLVIVRDALLNLLRKKQGTNFFREEGTEKFVKQCIMKLNPNARKHMSIVFPEMKDKLFNWTEEERAQIQADSLIRQYVKMLLS